MKKKYYIVIALFFIFVSLGIYDISSPNISIFESHSKILPEKVKGFLKKNIFYIPAQLQKVKNLEDDIKIHKDLYFDAQENSYFIYSNLINLLEYQSISLFREELIESKNSNKYFLSLYKLPFLEYYSFKDKPTAYLEIYENNLIIVSGDGLFFKANISNLSNKKLNLIKIKSNLETFKIYKKIKVPGWLSIKDITVNENNLYLSIPNEMKKDCYNFSVLKTDLNNLEELSFELFYEMDQCQSSSYKEFLGHQSGGRLEFFENYMLMSLGDFRNRTHAQDDNSLFGKLISIDKSSKDIKIISKGHRNIQGLAAYKNFVISSEHGPAGGDEINIHKNILDKQKADNYGWPISSYGRHYNKVLNLNKSLGTLNELKKVAPLHKSHEEFGFIEPIRYFAPGSVAASEIEPSNNSFDNNFSNDFYFGVLRNNFRHPGRLFHFKFNNEFDKIVYEDEIILSERIRDIIIPKNSKNMYLLLESIPALGIINKVE